MSAASMDLPEPSIWAIAMIGRALAASAGHKRLELLHIRQACSHLPLRNTPLGHAVERVLNIRHEELLTHYSDMATFLIKVGEHTAGLATDLTVQEVLDKISHLAATETRHDSPYTSSSESAAAMRKNATTALQQIGQLKQQLKELVFGQDQAIEAICDGLAKSLYRTRQSGPAGVFLFVGPSATGKSHLAEHLASQLEGEWQTKVINMAAFTNENQSSELDGNEPSFSNAKPGGLTSYVREHPQTVVVFDNVDKCHPVILSRIQKILDSGQLRDLFGFYENNDPSRKKLAEPDVDFSKTLIICTTQAGHAAYEDASFAKLVQTNPDHAKDMLLHEMTLVPPAVGKQEESRQFGPGLLDHWRTGAVVFFQRLALPHLMRITGNAFASIATSLQTSMGASFDTAPDEDVLKALVLSQCPDANARNVGETSLQPVFDCLTDHLLAGGKLAPQPIRLKLDEAGQATLRKLEADLKGEPLLNDLFRKNKTLAFQVHLASPETAPCVELRNLEIKRVAQAADYRGAGAVRVEVPEISFQDIAGHELIKQRLRQVVHLLQAPDKLQEHKVGLPKGMLLHGQPGTGKTMFAKALAHEADLPFIATTGTELLDHELLKQVFQRARKYAPSILFIDEIDVIGRRDQGGRDVTINQLLAEIDGFDTGLAAPVFIIAATNLPDRIDPAILRAGRIDLHMEVPVLDRPARQYFIEQYRKLPVDDSFNAEALLDASSGMSGADLERVRREAVLDMVRQDKTQITQAMLLEQINTAKHGQRRRHESPEAERRHTAYHEAGHAVVSRILNPEQRIEQITITARGNAAGFVALDREGIVKRQTRLEILEDMAVFLAGRLAQVKLAGIESKASDGPDSGAGNDLAQASRLAYGAITTQGLDDEFGLLSLAFLNADHPLHNAAATLAQDCMRAWLDEATLKARQVLDANWDRVAKVADWLLVEEIVSGAHLDTLMDPPEDGGQA